MTKISNALTGFGAGRLRVILPFTFLLLIIEFFDEFHYGIESAALPALRADLGLSYAQAGLLLGLPGLLSVFTEPVIMLLGDTRLRKTLVLGGGLLICAGAMILATANGFPAALTAMIILFPASGAFVTLSQATLISQNPGREAQMMARWTFFGSIGNLIGPLMVAGLFALGFTWRANYLVVAALVLSLTLLASTYRFNHSNGTDPAQGDREEEPANFGSIARGLKIVLLSPGLMRWFILIDLADLLLDVYTSYAALYFVDVVGMTTGQVGVMMSAMMAAGLAGNALLIPILERVPGRKLVRVTAALAGLLYAAWLLAPWTWAKIILAIVIEFTTMGWYEVLQGEAYAAVPGRSGTVMAISSITGVLGSGLVWFVGWFAGQAGLENAMWLLLAGPVALLLWTPSQRRARKV
jgi:FSR family fosmidomycin resistance protein-like MFS transporter